MRLGKLASRLARNEGFCPCVYVHTVLGNVPILRNGNLRSKQLVSVIARPVTLPRSPQCQPRTKRGLSQLQRYTLLYLGSGWTIMVRRIVAAKR